MNQIAVGMVSGAFGYPIALTRSLTMPTTMLGWQKVSNVLPPDHKGLIEVVDRTAHIENLMNQVIEGYCGPRQDRFDFFWSILLDSSIMPLGGKVRAVSAIAQQLKFEVNTSQLHNILSLRNAFAHHATNSHPLIVVGRTPERNSPHYQLNIISSSGKITRKKREEALKEFRAAYKTAKKNLVEFISVVKEHNARYSSYPNG